MSMGIFENCKFLYEASNKVLDLHNIDYKEEPDKKVDKDCQPAYKVKFYDANGVYFGKASACYDPESDRQFLYNVEVVKKFRGQGLSHIIVKYMIKKYKVSRLHVEKDNTPAIVCYKKHGFKIVQDYGGNNCAMQR